MPRTDAAIRPATLHLMVGLPGAGKTTAARALCAEAGALLLSPDEWMIPLFGESDPDGRRDVLEGRLISVALQAVRLGLDAVLDFGFWGREERWALLALADAAGGIGRVIYLPVSAELQRERVALRWSIAPEQTFAVTEEDLVAYRAIFQVPDAAELAGRYPPAPAERASWSQWATERWPSLTLPSSPALPSPALPSSALPSSALPSPALPSSGRSTPSPPPEESAPPQP